MIVKNEANVLRRCLEAARPLSSRWLIVDTGSTDGTQALAQEIMADLPGQLVERPWRNFGENLTEALTRAAALSDQPHNILRLDADMTVHGSLESFQCDAGLVSIEDGDLRYRLPLLVRSGLPWRYEGVTHEYLDCDRPYTRANVEGLSVTHHADGANRHQKFLRDRELLRRANLADPRNVFYLAQTEQCLGNDAEAIRLYDWRATMGGWEEEAWYAAYQSGVLQLRSTPGAGIAALWRTWQRRPWRAEPLYELARYCRIHQHDHLALKFAEQGLTIGFPHLDILFVHGPTYAWALLWEVWVLRGRLGDTMGAQKAYTELLARPLPAHIVQISDFVKPCTERSCANA